MALTGCTDCGAVESSVAANAIEHRVAVAGALPEGGRLHTQVQGRFVTILRHNGQLSCIDSVCFHAGGPLGLGDIEDVNGNPCLVCPWHYYKIDVRTGDKYYQQISFENGKMVAGAWVSNGIKQRTHTAVERDGSICVVLSKAPPVMESDQYAHMLACGERVMRNRAAQQGSNVGGDGKQPSGAVLKAARDAALASGASGSQYRPQGGPRMR